jgi:hypothetical protein
MTLSIVNDRCLSIDRASDCPASADSPLWGQHFIGQRQLSLSAKLAILDTYEKTHSAGNPKTAMIPTHSSQIHSCESPWPSRPRSKCKYPCAPLVNIDISHQNENAHSSHSYIQRCRQLQTRQTPKFRRGRAARLHDRAMLS